MPEEDDHGEHPQGRPALPPFVRQDHGLPGVRLRGSRALGGRRGRERGGREQGQGERGQGLRGRGLLRGQEGWLWRPAPLHQVQGG